MPASLMDDMEANMPERLRGRLCRYPLERQMLAIDIYNIARRLCFDVNPSARESRRNLMKKLAYDARGHPLLHVFSLRGKALFLLLEKAEKNYLADPEIFLELEEDLIHLAVLYPTEYARDKLLEIEKQQHTAGVCFGR